MKERIRKATPSPWVAASNSGIHGNGLFAKCAIPKGTGVIEYVGRVITKAEAERIEDERLARADRGERTAIYTFILNTRYDIDGNVSWNVARFANHSCDPNCEALLDSGHIWITALRDITPGEEITYDYRFDWNLCRDHPCHCGAGDCTGYILRKDLRWRLRRRLSREQQETAA